MAVRERLGRTALLNNRTCQAPSVPHLAPRRHSEHKWFSHPPVEQEPCLRLGHLPALISRELYPDRPGQHEPKSQPFILGMPLSPQCQLLFCPSSLDLAPAPPLQIHLGLGATFCPAEENGQSQGKKHLRNQWKSGSVQGQPSSHSKHDVILPIFPFGIKRKGRRNGVQK